MATRVVIVEFESGVTPQQVAEFEATLRALAEGTANLVRMICGKHCVLSGESVLSANAPSVVFGNFLSVWEFNDEQALEEFVIQPIHREMASKKFRQLVKRRYVANIR